MASRVKTLTISMNAVPLKNMFANLDAEVNRFFKFDVPHAEITSCKDTILNSTSDNGVENITIVRVITYRFEDTKMCEKTQSQNVTNSMTVKIDYDPNQQKVSVEIKGKDTDTKNINPEGPLPKQIRTAAEIILPAINSFFDGIKSR